MIIFNTKDIPNIIKLVVQNIIFNNVIVIFMGSSNLSNHPLDYDYYYD
jgi:hypothetical protein